MFGALAAAAACAKLRKLDADHTAIAIAIGASQASGIMSNFGTMTKPFHAGKAAHSGIMSARFGRGWHDREHGRTGAPARVPERGLAREQTRPRR
ncbi:MAG: MmgE/PrpD family protein [Arenicellales bacterium]